MDPDQASYFSNEKGTFGCIDGSRTIDFSKVNDNYCDCGDGSDEPDHKEKVDGEEAERQRVDAEEAAVKEAEAAKLAEAEAGKVAETQAVEAAEEEEETDEEKGQRIAAQWTRDPEAVGDSQWTRDPEAVGDSQPPAPPPPVDQPLQTNSERTVHPDVSAAQQRLSLAEQTVGSLQKEKGDLQRFTSQDHPYDYGPNEMFVTLAGRCLTEFVGNFNYEVCFFSQATQTEKENKLSLGWWKGLSENYTNATFQGGKPCGELAELEAFEAEIQAEIDARVAEYRGTAAKDEL
eukprot:gene30881-35929_t